MIMKMPTYILQPILPTAIEVASVTSARQKHGSASTPASEFWLEPLPSVFHHDAHWHVSWHLLRVNRLRLITLVPE